MDWSTINIEQLYKLPVYTLPPTYRLSDGVGSGCFMDPPGFPTYFLKHVYDRHGNQPDGTPDNVIKFGDRLFVVANDTDWEIDHTWETVNAVRAARLKDLWRPLNIDHARTWAWMSEVKGYFKNCFVDPRKPKCNHAGELQIGLSSNFLETMGVHFGLEVPVSVLEHRVPEPGEVPTHSTYVMSIRRRTERAYLYIQEWYPEFSFGDYLQIRVGYGKGGPGNWWETFDSAARTADECNTQLHERYGTNGYPHAWIHPVNKTWCQQCGWHGEQE